jgi:bifunctional DNA-binding transcriptional regulator/antitoxin component of YhaV-PrlF toxin-antitoxin module
VSRARAQVTIPVEVRRLLGVGLRSKVAFVVEPDGTVQIKAPRYASVRDLAGAAGSLKKPLSWPEMRAIAYEDRFAAKPSSTDA